MSPIHLLLLIMFAVVAVIAAGCTQPASTGQEITPAPAVNMSVPFAPIPVASPDGINIAYELELAKTGNQTFVPEKLEVIDPARGTVVFSADGDLLHALYHPAASPAPTAEELMIGTGKVPVPRISVWFKVRPGEVPDRLVHHLTLNRSAGGLSPVTLTGGDVVVRKDREPVVIGSPLWGPGWIAMETTSPTTHHFLAQITLGNVTRVPQRYAQDWIYIDPSTGEAVSGNVTIAKNYFGYGKEIHAVANGTVVDLMDGIPDNEYIYAAPTPTIATLAGNYVIVDIGNGKYACFAHMIPGSITVKKGDAVTEGQVIGLMGNSGNSDLPHLHFQVVTGTPSFLGAEGYPHVYRSFVVIGSVNQTLAEERQSHPGYTMNRLWSDFGDFVIHSQKPVSHERMLTENWDILKL